MEKIEAEQLQETTSEKKVADLTVGELRQIIREVVQELLWDLETRLPDPDDDLEYKPEFEAEMQEFDEANKQGKVSYVSRDEVSI